MTVRPLDPATAAARGLTPADRARAMDRAKQAAFHLVHAVHHRNAHLVQRICDGLAPEELAAVAITLAECADLYKLKHVKDVPDNGMPPGAAKLAGAA